MDSNTKLIVIAIVAALVGVGAGYGIGAVMSSGDDATDYHFYLYFEADDERNGWYSGAASDAAKGFDKAMSNADMEYEINEHGYIGSLDDLNAMWSAYDYIYKDTSPEAAIESAVGDFLNGWNEFAGYGEDTDTFKISQSVSTIFFFSVYSEYDDEWYAPSPGDITDWMEDGPFKA